MGYTLALVPLSPALPPGQHLQQKSPHRCTYSWATLPHSSPCLQASVQGNISGRSPPRDAPTAGLHSHTLPPSLQASIRGPTSPAQLPQHVHLELGFNLSLPPSLPPFLHPPPPGPPPPHPTPGDPHPSPPTILHHNPLLQLPGAPLQPVHPLLSTPHGLHQ